MGDEPGSLLQREIQQNRPFRSRGQEALLGVLRTADLMRRIVGGVLEPFGVTMQQYNVLRILRGAGEAGLPTLAIADRMIERTPGVTRLLDRLEAKGWVQRERTRADRRQVLCQITAAGRELLARVDGPMAGIDQQALGCLTPAEVEQLITLLDRVRQGTGSSAPDLGKREGGTNQ